MDPQFRHETSFVGKLARMDDLVAIRSFDRHPLLLFINADPCDVLPLNPLLAPYPIRLFKPFAVDKIVPGNDISKSSMQPAQSDTSHKPTGDLNPVAINTRIG